MDHAESKLIKFIDHLPPHVNPYLAVAEMIEAQLRGPISPLWSRRFRLATLGLLGVIVGQASYLLFQRARLQRPKLVFNHLGLLVVDMSWISVAVYLTYGPVTIFVITLIYLMDEGYAVNQSTIVMIFGVKFFPIVLGSWALIWICACQCASQLWTSSMAASMNRKLLRISIRWGFSITFVILAFGPLPFITWAYAQAFLRLRQIESLCHHLNLSLRSAASTYDPQNFNKFSFLSLLIPAQRIPSLQEQMEDFVYIGLALYCGVICVLICIHAPLLWISLRGLYKQCVSQSAIDAALGPREPSRKPSISRELRYERQRLVLHAICVFLSTGVHLPPVIWKMTLVHTRDFVSSAKGKEISYSGLTIPLSITGNIILLILNIQAHQLLRKQVRSPDTTFLCISLSHNTAPSTNPNPLYPEKPNTQEDAEQVYKEPRSQHENYFSGCE